MDAIRLLEQDHHEVEQLFDQYDRANDREKQPIVQRICMELEAHTQIEQEIFYPAVRSGLGQDGEELVAEGLAEHQHVTQLIQQIRGMSPADQAIPPKLMVLMEDVRHHVDEEESEMFPLVQSSMTSDIDQLGQQMEQRKQEILAKM